MNFNAMRHKSQPADNSAFLDENSPPRGSGSFGYSRDLVDIEELCYENRDKFEGINLALTKVERKSVAQTVSLRIELTVQPTEARAPRSNENLQRKMSVCGSN